MHVGLSEKDQLLPICEYQDDNTPPAIPPQPAMRKSDSRDVRWVEVRTRFANCCCCRRPCIKFPHAAQPSLLSIEIQD